MKKLLLTLVFLSSFLMAQQKVPPKSNNSSNTTTKPATKPADAKGGINMNENWYLSFFQIKDEKSEAEMKTIVDGIIKKGFIPTGFEIKKNIVYMLFSKVPNLKATKWVLTEMTMPDLEKGITSFVLNKYIPMDFVYKPTPKGNSMYVLFVLDESNYKIDGWKTDVITIGKDIKETSANIKKSIEGQKLLNYTPFGITQIASNKLVFLYNKVVSAQVSDLFFLKTYPNDGKTAPIEIEKEAKKGYHPWGISLINNELWITFIQ